MINDLHDMFSHDYEEDEIGRKKLESCGNEGGCRFKFFVKANDQQSVYALVALSINMSFFAIISLCYSVIKTCVKAKTELP